MHGRGKNNKPHTVFATLLPATEVINGWFIFLHILFHTILSYLPSDFISFDLYTKYFGSNT